MPPLLVPPHHPARWGTELTTPAVGIKFSTRQMSFSSQKPSPNPIDDDDRSQLNLGGKLEAVLVLGGGVHLHGRGPGGVGEHVPGGLQREHGRRRRRRSRAGATSRQPFRCKPPRNAWRGRVSRWRCPWRACTQPPRRWWCPYRSVISGERRGQRGFGLLQRGDSSLQIQQRMKMNALV